MKSFAPLPVLVASGLFGAALLAGPALAQSGDAAPAAAAATTDMAKGDATKGDKSGRHAEWSQHVEKRISDLHQKLQIKPEQEQLWNAVAQTMRDNATQLGDLVRAAGGGTNTTAIEDLQNYQKIAQAHADGTAHLVSAFQPLYDSMSADQKKVADTVFEEHRRHGGPHQTKDKH